MFLLQVDLNFGDPLLLGIVGLTISIIAILLYIIIKTRQKSETEYKQKPIYEQLNESMNSTKEKIFGANRKQETPGYKIIPNNEELVKPKTEMPAENMQVQEPKKVISSETKKPGKPSLQWESEKTKPPIIQEIKWDPETKRSSFDPPTYLTPKEVKQVERLVEILMPKKDNYTAEQISKVIVEEGYSQRVAREVVRRIYDFKKKI